MQDCLDFLVAPAQVAGSVGCLHVIVVSDAVGERGEQFWSDRLGVESFLKLS